MVGWLVICSGSTVMRKMQTGTDGTEKMEKKKTCELATRAIKRQKEKPKGWVGGSTSANKTQRNVGQNFPSCSTCFPLRLRTPGSSIKHINKWGRGSKKGNSRRIVKKESVIIQLALNRQPKKASVNPSAIHYLHTSLPAYSLYYIQTHT